MFYLYTDNILPCDKLGTKSNQTLVPRSAHAEDEGKPGDAKHPEGL